MSDLPGEMTKQILFAPPRIIRSTRYSLTALGRSTPSSMRLPTGSSSLLNASGWMRLPAPAAGTMPHISTPSCQGFPRPPRLRRFRGVHRLARAERRVQQPFQLRCAAGAGVLVQCPLPRAAGDGVALRVRHPHGPHDVVRAARHDDLLAGGEERVQPLPVVADDG